MVETEYSFHIDEYFQNELIYLCTSLGSWVEDENGNKYYEKSEDCVEWIKDLIKSARRNEVETACWMVKLKVMKQHITPLLCTYRSEDFILLFQLTHLLTKLTMPVDPTSDGAYRMLSALQSFKEACIEKGVLSVFVQSLVDIFAKKLSDRSEKEIQYIELVLTLLRNLACIPDAFVTSYTSQTRRCHLQEELILRFQDENVFDMLLSMTASLKEKEHRVYNFLLMEIFYSVFVGVNPDDLVSLDDKAMLTKETNHLKDLIAKEKDERHLLSNRMVGSANRHLVGSVVVQGPNGRRILHGGFKALKSSGDQQKPYRERKRVVQDENFVDKKYNRLEVLGSLRSIATTFLNNCFNVFVTSVHHELIHKSRTILESDYANFLFLCQFFLRFHRGLANVETKELEKTKSLYVELNVEALKKPTLWENVGAILNLDMFQFVMKMSQNYLEEKFWQAMHVSVCVLKEMLLSTEFMRDHHVEGTTYHEAAQSILNNMFYQGECVHHFKALINLYSRQSRGYLVDLVLAIHTLLRVLEKYAKMRGHVYVRAKRRQRSVKKKQDVDAVDPENPEAEQEQEDEVEEKGSHYTNPSNKLSTKDKDDNEELEDDDEDDDDYTKDAEYNEKRYDFETFELLFANENVVQNYCILLKDFQRNSLEVNHAIVKMFYRISLHCKMEAIFYKLSFLTLVKRVMDCKATISSRNIGAYDEIYDFGKYTVHQFFKRFKKYPLLGVELLFSKGRSDCQYIQSNGNPNSEKADKELSTNVLGASSTLMINAGDTEGEGYNSCANDKAEINTEGNSVPIQYPRESGFEVDLPSSYSEEQKMGLIVSYMVHSDESSLVDQLRQLVLRLADRLEMQSTCADDHEPMIPQLYPAFDEEEKLLCNENVSSLLRLAAFTPPAPSNQTPIWTLVEEDPLSKLQQLIKYIEKYLYLPLDVTTTISAIMNAKEAFQTRNRTKKQKKLTEKATTDSVIEDPSKSNDGPYSANEISSSHHPSKKMKATRLKMKNSLLSENTNTSFSKAEAERSDFSKRKRTKKQNRMFENNRSKNEKMTGFLLYSKEQRRAIQQENPRLSIEQISKLVADKWRALTVDEKAIYKKSTSDGVEITKDQPGYEIDQTTKSSDSNNEDAQVDTEDSPSFVQEEEMRRKTLLDKYRAIRATKQYNVSELDMPGRETNSYLNDTSKQNEVPHVKTGKLLRLKRFDSNDENIDNQISETQEMNTNAKSNTKRTRVVDDEDE